jgi:hypothetical protein
MQVAGRQVVMSRFFQDMECDSERALAPSSLRPAESREEQPARSGRIAYGDMEDDSVTVGPGS